MTLSVSETATIYYITDGSDPSAEITNYSGTITITDDKTLKNMAVDPLGNQSQIYTQIHRYTDIQY